MAKSVKSKSTGGFSERIKEGLDGSKRSLERIEAEGEKLLRNVGELAEKYVPDTQRRAIEDLAKDVLRYIGQINTTVEENTKKLIEKLNIPTKKELEEYNRKVHSLIEENVRTRIDKLKVPSAKEMDQLGKQMKKNVEEQTVKVLGRLNIATKKDMETVVKDLKKLRKDVNSILKPSPTPAKAPQKKGVKS
jgi:hypothetical protein